MMQINTKGNKPHFLEIRISNHHRLFSCSLILLFLYAVAPTFPPLRELMVNQATQHLGKPYLQNPLDAQDDEWLVTRRDSFDCVTLIEDVLSHALAEKADRTEKADSFLITLRYRDGLVQGYESRIHYFSEWLFQAEKNGYGKNISAELNGQSRQKTINFMTENPTLYPKLKSQTHVKTIRNSEKTLSKRAMMYIPKSKVKFIENQLLPGDILAFTTEVMGLDIFHTAMIFKVTDRVQMIHASSKNKKVEVSNLSINHWMRENKKCDGVIVFRPE